MTRILGSLVVASALLSACGGGDDTTDTSGTLTTTGCTSSIIDFYPGDGATDVYYRTTVEFTFDVVDGSETITVSQGGSDVAGTTTVEGTRVIFTPDAPLMASTTYDVSVGWCKGPTTLTWTTSGVGDAADETGLPGNAYSLDIGNGRFVEPAGVGDIIGSLLEQEVLIGVTAADAASISMMGALGDGNGMQDMCTESFDFPVAADFSENPYFSIESDSLALDISGVAVTIDDLRISGAFAADASYIAGATLQGTLDVNILADLVGEDPCGLLLQFGVPCEECSDGSGAHCLSVLVDNMQADRVDGLMLETVTTADVEANCGGGTTTP